MDFSIFSPQWQLRHQNRNSPRSLCEHARIFEPRGFVDERLDNGGLIKIHTRPFRPNRSLYVFFKWFLCFYFWAVIWSYIVDLFAALHELASARARTLLKLASSVRALLKPYGVTLIARELLRLLVYHIKGKFVQQTTFKVLPWRKQVCRLSLQ